MKYLKSLPSPYQLQSSWILYLQYLNHKRIHLTRFRAVRCVGILTCYVKAAFNCDFNQQLQLLFTYRLCVVQLSSCDSLKLPHDFDLALSSHLLRIFLKVPDLNSSYRGLPMWCHGTNPFMHQLCQSTCYSPSLCIYKGYRI